MSKENKKTMLDLQDLIWRQMREDRDATKQSYEDLKKLVTNVQDYAINGLTLSKLIELMGKQTSQIIEFYKILDKNQEENPSDFSDEELEKIYDEIKKENKK